MQQIRLSDRAHVEAALASRVLVPPDAPTSIGSGSMAALRDAMARFSGPDEHGPRRRCVEEAIDSLDSYDFAAVALERTQARLAWLAGRETGCIEAIDDIGFIVPTQVLGLALGVAESDLADLLADTAAVARVIGRGEPCTDQDDGHADRLLSRFADDRAVAFSSLLYQNHDATAALLASHLHALAIGVDRQSALAQTVRVAIKDCAIASVDIEAGQRVELDLASSGFEFGSGPHTCPGQRVAEQIVRGICGGLHDAGCRPIAHELTFKPDGRPSTIPMEQS